MVDKEVPAYRCVRSGSDLVIMGVPPRCPLVWICITRLRLRARKVTIVMTGPLKAAKVLPMISILVVREVGRNMLVGTIHSDGYPGVGKDVPVLARCFNLFISLGSLCSAGSSKWMSGAFSNSALFGSPSLAFSTRINLKLNRKSPYTRLAV